MLATNREVSSMAITVINSGADRAASYANPQTHKLWEADFFLFQIKSRRLGCTPLYANAASL
jgi:hypothetical protein